MNENESINLAHAVANDTGALDVEQPSAAPVPEEQLEASSAPPASITPEDMARAVSEAEQRGYLRGRNEAVSLAMAGPAMWEEPRGESKSTEDEGSDSDSLFLRHIRPSVWD